MIRRLVVNLRANFLINSTYLGFAALGVAVVGWAARKEVLTRRQKLFTALSCLTALVLAAAIIGWQL